MITKTKTAEGTILTLTRKDKVWQCSECKKRYSTIPSQCSCGAVDKVFDEVDLAIKEGPRKLYTVQSNFLYDIDQISKNSIVSLITDDKVTKDLVTRKLVIEIPTVAEEKK